MPKNSPSQTQNLAYIKQNSHHILCLMLIEQVINS